MGINTPDILERLARTMARLHTLDFCLLWAQAMEDDGLPCPWYPTWQQWAHAAKAGEWPDMSKAPWEM